MLFAMNVMLLLFLILEFMRLRLSHNVSFLKAVGIYFNQFTAPEMHGRFLLAHIYLLAGCALPLELMYYVCRGHLSDTQLFYSLCGVMFLSVGDTMVLRVVKVVWDSRKQLRSDHMARFEKDIFGDIGRICIYNDFQHCADAVGDSLEVATASTLVVIRKFTNSTVATLLMILLEGFTHQNDNLLIPTFYLAIYLILDKLNPIQP